VGEHDETEETMQSRLAAYALGILDPVEVTALEAHLPGCAACRDELSALQRATQALDLAAEEPDLALPAGHAERFARKLAAAPRRPSPRRAPALPGAGPTRLPPPGAVPGAGKRGWAAQAGWAAAALLALLVVAVGLWAFSLQGQIDQTRVDLARAQQEAAQARADRDRLQQDLQRVQNERNQFEQNFVQLQREFDQLDADRRAALAILGAPGVMARPLTGTPDLPGAVGNLWIDPATNRGLLVTGNLPPPAAGEIYELWLIAEAPVPAGVFQTGPDNTGWLLVDPDQPFASFQLAAITNEPAPGGLTPTGTILLQGGL
jgi:hypothetical protein